MPIAFAKICGLPFASVAQFPSTAKHQYWTEGFAFCKLQRNLRRIRSRMSRSSTSGPMGYRPAGITNDMTACRLLWTVQPPLLSHREQEKADTAKNPRPSSLPLLFPGAHALDLGILLPASQSASKAQPEEYKSRTSRGQADIHLVRSECCRIRHRLWVSEYKLWLWSVKSDSLNVLCSR
jgi:hypothetical protein